MAVGWASYCIWTGRGWGCIVQWVFRGKFAVGGIVSAGGVGEPFRGGREVQDWSHELRGAVNGDVSRDGGVVARVGGHGVVGLGGGWGGNVGGLLRVGNGGLEELGHVDVG